MVEKSIRSASLQLGKAYEKKYDKIIDIIDIEVDIEDINDILKEQAQPSENNFIHEIKEQIILNA